jgi:iron complex transport system substrate-binding protein
MQRTAVAVVIASIVGVLLVGGVAAGDSLDATATMSDDATLDGVSSQQECDFPVEITDETGETVRLDEEPEEVVVLAPSAAQHMWEIGAQEKVTGMPVNQFTAYLDGSDERENVVGQYGTPNQEKVVGLEPDLVLAPNIISEDAVNSLREAGLTVYYSPVATSVDDVYGELERVGKLVGACEGAEQSIDEMQTTVEQIENAVADEESPSVYYDLGWPWTAGAETLENDIITRAGGQNIALEADTDGYFEISEEVIAANDPEWIIISEGAEVPDVTALQESTAVQEDQIIEVNPNFISQHGPRNVIPLEAMAESFHPEAIAEMRATPTPTPTPTATPEETDEELTETATDEEMTDEEMTDEEMTDEEMTETEMNTEDEGTATATEESDGSGPGFTVGAAAVALLTAGLLARYRR